MRFQLLTLALMVACFYLSTSQANSLLDCCLKYYQVKYPRRLEKHIIKYREQTTGGSCNLHAIVLHLKRGALCVNPKEDWVKNYITSDKNRRKSCEDASKPCKRRKKH
ncbi:C-C motif chemokine 20-like [Cetorhinus maximus]